MSFDRIFPGGPKPQSHPKLFLSFIPQYARALPHTPSINCEYSSPALAQPVIPSRRMTLSISDISRSTNRSSNQPAARVPRPLDEPKQIPHGGASVRMPDLGETPPPPHGFFFS